VGPLFKVSATGGGEPTPVTRLDVGQEIHRYPQFLPDGRHFIYFVGVGQGMEGGVYLASLDDGTSKRVTNADSAAVVSTSGFLFFKRQTSLFAQALDFKKLELNGSPFRVADQVAIDPRFSDAGFSVAPEIVAYRARSESDERQLTWVDRSGKNVGTVGAPDVGLADVELSPDGRRVAVQRLVNGNTDIWLIDTVRGVPSRFTFDASPEERPIWSPDGSRVVFASRNSLYSKNSTGGEAEEFLVQSDLVGAPHDWSPDGRFLLYRSGLLTSESGTDLWILPMFGDKKPFPFVKTPFNERDAKFSPDGRWVAYQSNESGSFEIYVQPFPAPDRKSQISTNGGTQVRWNKNGKEIFYISSDGKMMSVPLQLSTDGRFLEIGTPVALFPVRIPGGQLLLSAKQQYAVSSDGERFLVNFIGNESTTSPITIIYNWKPKATQ
jgi:tricorn protease-like protein